MADKVIAARDMSAWVITSIHTNLCLGTLSRFADVRPDIMEICQQLLSFEVCGEYMLTEIGHGLDARNLETTATVQPDGSFRLHSPNESSSKAMPPTTPRCGMPRVAVVFARLIVQQEDRGVKPFLVHLCDSNQMLTGITSKPLPTRPGTKPIDHAITNFNNVYLPPQSLLGPIEKAGNERLDFLQQIERVSVGTLSLSVMAIAALKVSAFIAAAYSKRRFIGDAGQCRSILTFSTQYRPIVQTWAVGIVLDHHARWTIDRFMSESNPLLKHALATIFKTGAMKAPRMLSELCERLGWQGLFAHNQINELALTLQGNTIAEGDTLVLTIRKTHIPRSSICISDSAFLGLASELLGGKYTVPPPKDISTPLAQREAALFQEAKSTLDSIGGYGNHRGLDFDQHILPRCRPLIEAISNRMAFEAARELDASPKVIDIFEKILVEQNIDWYLAHGLIDGPAFHRSAAKAYSEALPDMLSWFEHEEIGKYCTAPIVSDGEWSAFLRSLPSLGSENRPVDYTSKL